MVNYMLIECFLLVMIVYLFFVFMYTKVDKEVELMSSYECGFDMNSFTRFSFSYRFFLISILFIVFDVEISLILPIPFLLSSSINLLIFFMFMLILVMGLIYEYDYGTLDWLEVKV